GCQALVVEAGAGARRTRLEQARTDALTRRAVRPHALGLRPRFAQHVEPRPGIVRIAEVPLLGRPEPGDRDIGVGAEELAQLAQRPYVEASLDPLGVGVERGVEAALGPAHLALCPAERVAADVEQPLILCGLPPVQVGAREQRV